MEQPTTPKRYKRTSEFIGNLEVASAVVLTLSGFSLGKGETWWAIGLACCYTFLKNYIDRCVPTDPITTTSISSQTVSPTTFEKYEKSEEIEQTSK